MKSFLILGTSLIDVILESKNPIQPFACNKVIKTKCHGGSMRNVAQNLAYLYQDVTFVSKFGNDTDAIQLQSHLEKLSVMVFPLYVSNSTPYFYNIQDKENNQMYASMTDNFYLSNTDYLPSFSAQEFDYAICDIDDSSLLNNLLNTVSSKWILSSNLSQEIDYSKVEGIVLNRHEFKRYAQNTPMDVFAQKYIHKGVKWVVVTLDQDGYYYYDKKGTYHKTVSSDSLFTLGCGDAFISGLLYGLTLDISFSEALVYAQKAAEITLQHPQSTTIQIKEIIK